VLDVLEQHYSGTEGNRVVIPLIGIIYVLRKS
jgi:hypothetical protein